MLALLVLAALAGAGPLAARQDPAQQCDAAADLAARQARMPGAVLRAIALTETGRKRAGHLRPWPWTVNLEGRGYWFETRQEALDFARQSLRAGRVSFDLGCFQINYRWHGKAFASLEEMIEPLAGARYAAAFLGRLHDELGDWSRAAGAYHSRTAALARRYRQVFDRHLARVEGAPPAAPPARGATGAAPPGRRPPRENTYPLLTGGPGAARAPGSLVPLGLRAPVPLFGG